MTRILITGSRDWEDWQTIYDILSRVWIEKGHSPTPILVSGACPTGADKHCEEFAVAMDWLVERYPADWERHGKKAGFIRNRYMVNQGADICLAFIKDNSKGASMTADLARKAGIETRVFRNDS